MQGDCDGAMSTIEWESIHSNLVFQGGSLQKFDSPDEEEKDALAISVDALEGPECRRCGIGFTLLGAGANFAVGLFADSNDCPGTPQTRFATLCRIMDFSVSFWAADTDLYDDVRSSCGVCEAGSCLMRFDEPAAGDQVEIVINVQGCVEYRLNGETRYQSRRCPKYPMKLGISAVSCGLLACDLRWIYGEAPAEWVVVKEHRVMQDSEDLPGPEVQDSEAQPRENISPSTTSSRWIPGDDDAESASSAVTQSIEAALCPTPAPLPAALQAAGSESKEKSMTSEEQEDVLLRCIGCIIEVLCSGLGAIVRCICQISDNQRKLLDAQTSSTPSCASAASGEPLAASPSEPLAA